MKSIAYKAIFLMLLANLVLTRHPEGSHSLRILQTVLTWPDQLEHQYSYTLYMDDIHVERLNSRAETPMLEHCAPWVDHHHRVYWEIRTWGILNLMNFYGDILKKWLHFYNQSETGYHTIQILTACYGQPGGNFSHGQFELLFKEQGDFIMVNEDLSTWTAVGKAAEILRQEWDQPDFINLVKTSLQGECMEYLLQHLQHGKEFLLRKDAPDIHVTHKSIADQKITLRCWAMNFYPAEISLTWKDENNQTLDMEVIETRPSGDGTFQKWAAVVVPSGEEQRYTCHVNHEGLPEPITVKWEPPQSSVPIMPIVTGLVLGAALMGAMVTFLIWKRRSKE